VFVSGEADTDQMVPKQFLEALTREGFGRILFYDWRYLLGEKPNPEFCAEFSALQATFILSRNRKPAVHWFGGRLTNALELVAAPRATRTTASSCKASKARGRRGATTFRKFRSRLPRPPLVIRNVKQ